MTGEYGWGGERGLCWCDGRAGTWRTQFFSREAIAVETVEVWRDLKDCLKLSAAVGGEKKDERKWDWRVCFILCGPGGWVTMG